MTSDETRQIRWGILSTAQIGTTGFLPAARATAGAVIKAVASRTQIKGRDFAERNQIPEVIEGYQNLLDDPVRSVERFVEQGVGVIGGMMVGFDQDGPDIFERQYEFAMQAPLPSLSFNTLNAPPNEDSTVRHLYTQPAGICTA